MNLRRDAQYQLHNSWLARFRKRMGWRDRHGAKRCGFCGERNPAATLTDTVAQITCRNCYGAGPCIMGGPERLVAAVVLWNKRRDAPDGRLFAICFVAGWVAMHFFTIWARTW